MQLDEIKSIIDFAINKEQEAIDFYNGLAERVKLEAIAEELKRLAAMEVGHKKKLQSLDVDAIGNAEPSKVADLKIANYTVNAVPHSEMTWPDIINIAMHRELAAVNLYNDLASIVLDESVKRLFKNLAAEEQKHKLYLESIWDKDVMKEN